MNKLILPLLLLLFSCTLQSQEMSKLTRSVQTFGKSFPQEKVYLHMDNTCYFLGDTIWYKAYVMRTDKKTPTDLSKILYVELLTPDGYLVERQQVPLENDTTGYGNFVLQDSLYGGYYELRAYTRWMLNFGRTLPDPIPNELMYSNAFYNKGMLKDFFREYEKLYSRVFPVYNKPERPGVYDRNMTTRPMRRYYRIRDKKPELDLKFYPEGGNLVAGTDSRVAFELNEKEGNHLHAELVVREKSSGTVIKTKTLNRGRGVFDLKNIPASARYEAALRYGGYDYTFSLPPTVERGCALRVEENKSHITFAIQSTGLPAHHTLGIHVLNNGNLVAQEEVTLKDGKQTKLTIDKAKFPTGVQQVTVFDAKGEVFAERLFFVNHHDYAQSALHIKGLKEEYAPFEPVELELSLPNARTSAHFSLSVRDAASSDNLHDNGTMLTEMLLASDLKGFVESPGYYFEKDDEEHRTALDLLLLVQGWRRYQWKDMAGTNGFQVQYLPEKAQTIAGSVFPFYRDGKQEYEKDKIMSKFVELQKKDNTKARKYLNKKFSTLKHEVNINADYIQDTFIVETKQKTQYGSFYMQTPRFFGQAVLFLSASDTVRAGKGTNRISQWTQKMEERNNNFMDETGYPNYYVKLNHFYPLWCTPYNYYQDNLPGDTFEKIVIEESLFRNNQLPMITVKTKRGGLHRLNRSKPAFVVSAYEAFNRQVDLGMNTGRFGLNGLYLTEDRSGTRNKEYIDKDVPIEKDTESMKSDDFGFSARTTAISYIGDMGVNKEQYKVNELFNSSSITGSTENLRTFKRLKNLDKLYFYTDFCPRERGSWKYEGANIPEVVIDYRKFPNNGQRPTYRDRNIVLPGFSICDEFYHADYSNKPLPQVKDYRRTLYWNPDLRMQPGETKHIRLYNNSKTSVLQLEAEGVTKEGGFIVNKL